MPPSDNPTTMNVPKDCQLYGVTPRFELMMKIVATATRSAATSVDGLAFNRIAGSPRPPFRRLRRSMEGDVAPAPSPPIHLRLLQLGRLGSRIEVDGHDVARIAVHRALLLGVDPD